MIIIWVQSPTLSLVICTLSLCHLPGDRQHHLGSAQRISPGWRACFACARRWQTLMRLRVLSALPYALQRAARLRIVPDRRGGSGVCRRHRRHRRRLCYQILWRAATGRTSTVSAALVLIATGVALFVLMGRVVAPRAGGWHERATHQRGAA